MSEPQSKFKYIIVQLVHHIPFSTFGVMVAILGMGFLTFITTIARADHLLPSASEELFHVFHPAHVLLSAVTTTAMFIKHDQRIIRAVCVGFFSSLLLCTISDVILPFWGGILLGEHMHLHIDLWERTLT